MSGQSNAPAGTIGEGITTTSENQSHHTAVGDRHDVVEIAQRHVAEGHVVIPVHGVGPDGLTCSCPKGRTCKHPGKHPVGDGWEQRRDGLDLLKQLVAKGRRVNVGILPGPSGLFVIDVDPRNGGQETMAALKAHHGPLPKSKAVRTGSGGYHLYYRRPEGIAFRGALGAGIDLKTSGMVVAEGSRSGAGDYSVLFDSPIIAPPAWLVELGRRPAPSIPTTTEAATEQDGDHLDDAERDRRLRYFKTAIESEVARLDAMTAAKTADGTGYRGEPWDQTTYAVACALLEIANTTGSGLTADEAAQLVRGHAPRDAGFGDVRVEEKIESARRKVGTKGRTIPAAPVDPFPAKSSTTTTTTKASAPEAEADALTLMGGRSFIDANVVDAFALRHADDVRCAGGRRWLAWDGARWRDVDESVIVEKSRVFAQDLAVAAAARGDADLAKNATKRMTKSAIAAVVFLVKGHPLISVDPGSLDVDRDLLNCPNGTVDLRTGEVRPHDPDDLITCVTRAEYMPDAVHPDLDTALGDIEPETRAWLQTRLGQALTGHPPPDDRIIFPHGGGANGKSTLVAAVHAAAGDYGVTVSDRVILAASTSQHPTELTDLIGARIALLEELPEQAHLSAKRVKSLAGTDTQTARRVHENSVAWDATHTLFVTTNSRPRVTETDHGMWRRLALVTFPCRYVGSLEEVEGPLDRVGDPGLKPRMKYGAEQQRAVLAWAVAGAVRHYATWESSPPLPAAVKRDTDAWRDSSDPLGTFIAERVRVSPGRCIAAADLHSEFAEFMAERGQSRWSDQTLSERMATHHVISSAGVEKRRPRVTDEAGHPSQPQVSYRPGNVTVHYADGQQITAWVGLEWQGQ